MDLFGTTGQQRRQWLDRQGNALGEAMRYYLGPSGVDKRLNALASVAPYALDGMDYIDAQEGARNLFADPSLTNALAFTAPMVALALPGVSNRLAQGMADVGGDAVKFAADESGALRLFGSDDVEARGAQIMDLLRSGRGADVTDEMLDMGDATANARLNEWMFKNYDLPMDEASRAARAGEMGFNGDLYHGTGADFPAFYDARRGNFFTDRPEIADIYAAGSTGGSASIRGQASNAGANYIPVKLRGPDLTVTDKGPDGSHGWLTDNIAASVSGVEKFPLGTYPRRLNDAARSQGYGAIRIDDMLDLGGEQTQWMSIDPSGIRSRFARFDPRLSHLRNLTASIGLPATAGLLGMSEAELANAMGVDATTGQPMAATPPRRE